MLIATEMIDMTIADVRHQLGASYGLHARLDESRLATSIVITGYIAADRAPEALALVRDRVAKLGTPDAVISSLFVTARRRVMTRLVSMTSGAAALAGLAERSVELERDISSSFTTAGAVRNLTIDAMPEVLRSIDLARSAVLIRGPEDAVTRSFAALGRKATIVP